MLNAAQGRIQPRAIENGWKSNIAAQDSDRAPILWPKNSRGLCQIQENESVDVLSVGDENGFTL
jgi:hypothetical protein